LKHERLQTPLGARSGPTDLQVRPVRRVHEDHQMSNTNTGGPAFPNEGGPGNLWNEKGMTLRDYFAAKAMQGELACQNVDGGTWHEINKLAVHAYQIADAMLKAREA
jgi:hypothetical protein